MSGLAALACSCQLCAARTGTRCLPETKLPAQGDVRRIKTMFCWSHTAPDTARLARRSPSQKRLQAMAHERNQALVRGIFTLACCLREWQVSFGRRLLSALVYQYFALSVCNVSVLPDLTLLQGGDCSTEYLADVQDPSTIPDELKSGPVDSQNAVTDDGCMKQEIEKQAGGLVRGRWGYSNLGAVRTKPGTSTLSR